jgi:hypothetical protein
MTPVVYTSFCIADNALAVAPESPPSRRDSRRTGVERSGQVFLLVNHAGAKVSTVARHEMGLSTTSEEEALRSPTNEFKSNEKAPKASKESASNQVLKTTYEKRKTQGATHEDKGGNNLKRKDATSDSVEKEKQSKREKKI